MRLLLVIFSLLFTTACFAASCTKPINLNSGMQWQGWGNGLNNARFTGDGLTSKDLGAFKLQWSFAFPGINSVVGNPVVQGSAIFIGMENGEVYALDLDTACVYWTFKADAGVRTAPAFANNTLYFGDRSTNVYAVNALSGQQIWKSKVEAHQGAILTGSPQVVTLAAIAHPNRVIVPVASSEEGLAAVPTYKCCSFRGSVVSLDAQTGEKLWQQHVIQTPAKPTTGNQQGPSGAGIWSAPTIDVDGKRIFVGTGDAYSAPADIATDAIVALDLIDGHILWINPGTTGDVWTVQCIRNDKPQWCGPDQDFGSPPMLVGSGAKQYLVAGQKSGWIRAYSLTGGSHLWKTAVVTNTEEFGGKVIWGGANDGKNAYFGLGSGGIVAVNLTEGKKLWFTEMQPSTAQSRHPGQDGPLTISNDLIISGGWDGVLRLLSTEDGKILWQYDTARDFTAINGAAGKGGSMGAAGPVVAGKHLLVPSGYVGVKSGIGGNVLLHFSP